MPILAGPPPVKARPSSILNSVECRLALPRRKTELVREHGNTSGLHGRAFDHPALWKKQPIIWIADDPLGIGKFETKRINDLRVEASTEFAHMDARGNLHVERSPPDEAWYGGFTTH